MPIAKGVEEVAEMLTERVAKGAVVARPSLPAKEEASVVEVEVREPRVSWPMVEEEMSSLTALRSGV